MHPARVLRRLPLLLLSALLSLSFALGATTPGAEAASWAPASQATIRPGAEMITDGAQCTANFVFTAGSDVLLGYAAHCAGLGGATDTNGCLAGSQPLGTPVQIRGAQHPGSLVYSSWRTMLHRGETDPSTCAFNDFALVRVDPRDHHRVNPSIPYWGGPTALGTSTTSFQKVYSYGNSSLRFGLEVLKPKEGYSLGQSAGGWNHTVYTLTPGIPGDSGSAFLDRDGRAVGVLSTLAIAPLAASNGVSDLALALRYANQHGGETARQAQLVPGTEPFRPGLLP